MKKTIGHLIWLLIVVVGYFVWIHRGYKIGEKEWKFEKQREIKGKVIRMYKLETTKSYRLVFNDSSEYRPSFFGLDKIIEVGDSVYKARNNYKFIIFKNGNVLDTAIFIGTNSIYER